MAIPAHNTDKSKKAGLIDFRRFLLMDAGTGGNPRCVRVYVFMFLLVRVNRNRVLEVIQESGG
jgi:hypothetical protein